MQTSKLVTGCPRSGTSYIAECIKRVGHPSQHEPPVDEETSDYVVDWRRAATDKDYIHLVRNPLDTIASMTTIAWWHHFEEHVDVSPHLPVFHRATLAWLRWCQLADSKCIHRARVEDLRSPWHANQMARRLGFGLDEAQMRRWCRVRTDVNTRKHVKLSWAMLDEKVPADTMEQVRTLAVSYGYLVDPPPHIRG